MKEYPKFLELFRSLEIASLESFKTVLINSKDFNLNRFECEQNVPKKIILQLIDQVIEEKVGHIRVEHFVNFITNKLTIKQIRELSFHASGCSQCLHNIKDDYLKQFSKIKKELFLDLKPDNVQSKQEHIDIDDIKRLLANVLNLKQIRELFLHIVSCSLCAIKVKEDYLPQFEATTNRIIDENIETWFAMEAPMQESNNPNEENIKTDASFNPEKKVEEEVVVIEKVARNVWMIEKIEKLKKINGLKNYKRIAAATAALALLIFGASYLPTTTLPPEEPKTTTSSPTKVKPTPVISDEQMLRFAKNYEEACEKLKNNRFDLDAILLRAESAEQLNLFGQAISDYERYLTTSTDIEAKSRVEDKLNAVRQKQTEIVDVEPTSYERLNKLIDDYLKAFIEGNSVAATDNLETAKAIAVLMLKDTGERVGIDTVEYYSKVSIDAAKQLLDARQEVEEISKIAAVDKFEESINKLEKAKNIFTQHQAISDIQRTIFLLAKFLIKADKVNTAKNEVNTWLKVAEEKSYLFNKAQLLYQQGQISVIEGVEQLSIQKASESLEICRMLYAGKFLLYPLLLVSQVYSAAGVEEITFIKSTEGVIKSLEYQNPGFFCQFLNRAGVASFGLKTPDLAEAYLRESLRVSQKENLHGYTAVTKSILAALLAEKGNLTEAKFLIEEAKVKDAAKTLDLMARKQQLFRIRAYEGKIYGLAKDFNKSERSYKEAIKIAAEVGYKQIAGFHHYKQGLAEALYEQGKKDEALKEILEAKEMQRKLLLNLQVESKNRLLKVNFSTKEIEELIDLIQR